MKKMKKYDMGGLAEAGDNAGFEKMMREMEASSYEKKRKPLPADDISPESKVPRPNLIDRAKGALGAVKDEYMRGVKNVGQTLGIAKDENQYIKTPQGERMANSDLAKGARNYVRMYKEGVGMKDKNDKYEYKKGGSVSSASKRADGCAVKGKTKGKMV
jgi:hypothetical protein